MQAGALHMGQRLGACVIVVPQLELIKADTAAAVGVHFAHELLQEVLCSPALAEPIDESLKLLHILVQVGRLFCSCPARRISARGPLGTLMRQGRPHRCPRRRSRRSPHPRRRGRWRRLPLRLPLRMLQPRRWSRCVLHVLHGFSCFHQFQSGCCYGALQQRGYSGRLCIHS